MIFAPVPRHNLPVLETWHARRRRETSRPRKRTAPTFQACPPSSEIPAPKGSVALAPSRGPRSSLSAASQPVPHLQWAPTAVIEARVPTFRKVDFVSNFTDVDDKIIRTANELGITEPAISKFVWNFSATHTSSPHFSTYVGSVLQCVLPHLQPGMDSHYRFCHALSYSL